MILLRRAWVLTFPRCGFASSFGTANARVAHAHRLASALPDCHMTLIPGAGHYFVLDKWRAILSKLASYD